MTPLIAEPIVTELAALRALARALVHGDGDADDLVQDTVIAALEHPPARDRPLRPWFGAVLRNRWRMAHRAVSRRHARELATIRAADAAVPGADELLDRARTLERLASALVELPEPFRAIVVRRYLDGESAAAIARSLDVPTGTVRWRLSEGLARLRAALAEPAQPDRARWQRALAPIAGVSAVKIKTASLTAVIVIVLALLGGAWWWHARRAPAPAPASGSSATLPVARNAAVPAARAIRDPRPGQGRAVVAARDLAGGAVSGHVINWSTGDGVDGADLTFTTAAGAESVHSGSDGAFRLVPTAPGTYTLATATAPGFLPYAPELAHSSVRVVTTANREVRGVTVFLYPALDYHGHVVDAAGAPVAGAHVRLLGTPAGEQAIDWLASEWTTDRDGAFTFHAADNAVLEASAASARGWAVVDGTVEVSKQLVIKLGDAPARTAVISGHVVDGAGAPLAGALVRAAPAGRTASTHDNAFHGASMIATAFVLSSPTGAFTLTELAPIDYDLTAELDDRAPVVQRAVAAGTTNVVLAMDRGIALAGTVVDPGGQPVPAFTLIVTQRTGVVDAVIAQRSVVDARGQFSIPVAAGDYQVVASASGWAPSARTPASAVAGGAAVVVHVSAGATLRGTVTSTVDGSPIRYARVAPEGRAVGASAQPTNAGTVTRADGSYELTGIPPGPLAVSIAADQCHPRIESGLEAHDGADLPPLDVALAPLQPGESPMVELIGIGVGLSAADDALRVGRVIPDSGAADAGILAGDLIVTIDGTLVTTLGMDDALAHIRGPVGTTIAIGVRRGDQQLAFTVVRRKVRF